MYTVVTIYTELSTFSEMNCLKLRIENFFFVSLNFNDKMIVLIYLYTFGTILYNFSFFLKGKVKFFYQLSIISSFLLNNNLFRNNFFGFEIVSGLIGMVNMFSH